MYVVKIIIKIEKEKHLMDPVPEVGEIIMDDENAKGEVIVGNL